MTQALERLADLLVELVDVVLGVPLGLLHPSELVAGVVVHGRPSKDSSDRAQRTRRLGPVWYRTGMPAHTHVSTLVGTIALLSWASAVLAQDAPADQAAPVSAREEVERLAGETMPDFATKGHRSVGIVFESAYSADGVTLGPRIGLHYFLADAFEVHASLGVWGHLQDGTDAASINPALGFRYHFVREPSHTIYADIGIGLLLSNEEVPEGGTRTNFTPRAGLGATFPLGDDGARLDVGLRWHHVSNASTSGTDDNPDRDGLGVYVGVLIPF
ncbi:MAG: hypothetical protein Tsb0013_12010 [Phycisphaerales bacterium]